MFHVKQKQLIDRLVDDNIRSQEPRKQGGGGGSSRPPLICAFKAMTEEYLVCKPFNLDGTVNNSAADILVSKPYDLRKSAYNGKTMNVLHPSLGVIAVTYAYVDRNTRTATSSLAVETQLITPDYQVDQEIRAGFERTTADDNGTPPKKIGLQDLNGTGRGWGSA